MVAGILVDGNTLFPDPPKTATVLERRQKDGIGMQVDYLFYIRVHSIPYIGDASCAAAILHFLQFDILQIADSSNTFQSTNLVEQSAMYG